MTHSRMSPLFLAVLEATQEAVYNSMFQATTMVGKNGRRIEAIPIQQVIEICKKYNVLNLSKKIPEAK